MKKSPIALISPLVMFTIVVVASACSDTTDSSRLDGANADGRSPRSAQVTTCPTSPPQYYWIFQGSCALSSIGSSGGGFSLAEYEDITVSGSLGKNNLTSAQEVAFTDARANGDISKWDDMTFPKYYGRYGGATPVIYVAVNNQGSQIIKLVNDGDFALALNITDSNGFPGNTCTIGVLTVNTNNTGYEWLTAGANSSPYSSDELTVVFPELHGLWLVKTYPLYFGVACK